jgi:DivIVA domain-containing protein
VAPVPAAVRVPAFRTTRAREGYDRAEVDAFLAAVVPLVASARAGDDLVARIRTAAFRPTRLRQGYDPAEVDAFLDDLVAQAARNAREVDADGRGAQGLVPATGAPVPAPPAFSSTVWREGYDREEVDALVDDVRQLLEHGPVPVGLPDRIAATTFQATRLQPGYDQDEVDDYLDVLLDAARTAVAQATSSPLTMREARRQARALAAPGRAPAGSRFERADKRESGYAVREVDAFAERVGRELMALVPASAADDVRATRFGRERAGYRLDEVDAWLADVAGHLTRRELG